MRSRTAPRTCARINRCVDRIVELLESRRLLSANVLTWHNDLARTGLNPNETQLTPADVNVSSFGKLFSYPVDGQLYAQPLYVSGLAIPGKGTHNVVFVATENNNVYAFDADSPSGSGGMLWKVNLGTPATLPNPTIYPPGGRYGPNISPHMGITGTPVIDLASNTMYVDAFTNDSGTIFNHRIHALDLTTGQDKVTPVVVQATYPGNGVTSDGTTVPFLPYRQLQRPALALLNGTVYVSYGSFSDGDPYHGWVLGFDANSLQLQSAYNDTPNLLTIPAGPHADEGAFWQAGAGPSSDGSNLYLMSGNGDFDTNLDANGFPTLQDYGDSFIKLSTASSTLTVSDYFTPYNQQALSDQDQDLGSAGPMVLPDSVGSAAHPHLLVGCGKEGQIYLIDRDAMGKFNSTTNDVVQQVSLGSGTWSNPAYFNGRIYFHGVNDVLKAFSISDGVLSTTPVVQGNVSYGYPGATPSISSNGTQDGIVWEIQGGGILHAYDATTLQELYNSSQAPQGRDTIGSYENFIVPAIADGKVFVGSANSVVIFGLFAPPTSAPAAPSSLKASQDFGSAVNLTWTNNANNELNFQVERSTDGTNFAKIATVPGVGQGATAAYADTATTVGQTYYYRVRAFNNFNGGTVSDPSNVASITVASPKTVFLDPYSTDTSGNYTESVQTPPPTFQDSWKVSNGTLNYTVSATNTWNSSVFLLKPSVANTAGLSKFTASGDIIGPKNYQPGLILTGDTTNGGFIVQEYNAGQYANHLVLLQETGAQLLGNEGGTGNPPVLADFGNISAHLGDTFHVSGAIDRTGAHPVITVSITDLTAGSFTMPTQTMTASTVPANYGGTQIGWRARWQSAPATFSVDNLGLQTPPAVQDVITGTGGNDTITLKKDGSNIDWTLTPPSGPPQAGQLPINDANGLTINAGVGNETIVLDTSNGSPLPNLTKLSGSFSTNGVPPLAAGQTLDMGTASLMIQYTGSSPLAQIQQALASGFDGGKWDGSGLTSSAAKADPRFGIADTDSADPLASGQPQNSILLSYALVGDLNQTHKVDFTDFVTLARNYNQTNADWAMGDFNYDGKVDFADFVALARNYGASAAAATATGANAGLAALSLQPNSLLPSDQPRRKSTRRH